LPPSFPSIGSASWRTITKTGFSRSRQTKV
jgi:hypothetical protein